MGPSCEHLLNVHFSHGAPLMIWTGINTFQFHSPFYPRMGKCFSNIITASPSYRLGNRSKVNVSNLPRNLPKKRTPLNFLPCYASADSRRNNGTLISVLDVSMWKWGPSKNSADDVVRFPRTASSLFSLSCNTADPGNSHNHWSHFQDRFLCKSWWVCINHK